MQENLLKLKGRINVEDALLQLDSLTKQERPMEAVQVHHLDVHADDIRRTLLLDISVVDHQS